MAKAVPGEPALKSCDAPVRLAVSPRARRISVKIDTARREAVVTAPSPRDMPRAEAFARERSVWIAQRLAALPAPQPFVEGQAITVRGSAHVLHRPATRGRHWVEAGPPAALCAPSLPEAFASRVGRALREEARHDLEAASVRYADRLGVTVRRVSVKDTRSRWGSCASDGTLAFSWRLVCAPPHVLEYVAAHEVAHLRVRNHSAAFWDLVSAVYGDYHPARRWLNEAGATLFAIGAER